MLDPTHLGDGAYVSETPAGIVITADHHDPDIASSAVYIDEADVHKLIAWLENYL